MFIVFRNLSLPPIWKFVPPPFKLSLLSCFASDVYHTAYDIDVKCHINFISRLSWSPCDRHEATCIRAKKKQSIRFLSFDLCLAANFAGRFATIHITAPLFATGHSFFPFFFCTQASLNWGKKDEPVYVTEESGVVGLNFHQSKEVLIYDSTNGIANHYDVRDDYSPARIVDVNLYEYLRLSLAVCNSPYAIRCESMRFVFTCALRNNALSHMSVEVSHSPSRSIVVSVCGQVPSPFRKSRPTLIALHDAIKIF